MKRVHFHGTVDAFVDVPDAVGIEMEKYLEDEKREGFELDDLTNEYTSDMEILGPLTDIMITQVDDLEDEE